MPFKNKAERRAAGLCARCSRKAQPGGSHCKPCLAKDRRRPTRRQNSSHYREWYYRTRYGIGLADFEAMAAKQGHACACCLSPFAREQPGKAADCLHVDHDHATGKVRGLLCLRCNRAVGLIRDNPDTAQRMAAYLREHQPRKAEGPNPCEVRPIAEAASSYSPK